MPSNPYHTALTSRLQGITGLGSDALNRAQQMQQVRQQSASDFAPTVGGGTSGGSANHAQLIAFGKELQKMGYSVGENPAFGNGRVGTHSKNSRHYSGNAIDVNFGAGTSKAEQDKLKIAVALSKKYGLNSIFMAPGHYNHAHFDVR